MAKKVGIMLVLAGMTAGTMFAKTWYDSYAPGIDTSKVLINGGLGAGQYDDTMRIPPIVLSADFKLPSKVKLPITIGATASLTAWERSIAFGRFKATYTDVGFGLRGAYHFNLVKNLDTYAGLILGYVVQTVSPNNDIVKTFNPATSFFMYSSNIGARYFFTKSIGVYVEVGYSNLLSQIANVGLSVKL